MNTKIRLKCTSYYKDRFTELFSIRCRVGKQAAHLILPHVFPIFVYHVPFIKKNILALHTTTRHFITAIEGESKKKQLQSKPNYLIYAKIKSKANVLAKLPSWIHINYRA